MATLLAEQGAATAAAHADAVSPSWSERAYDYLVAFGSKLLVGKTFMTEDVRIAAETSGAVPQPPTRRAWGAIILRAKREGLLIHAGFAPNKDPSCHGSPKSVWCWNPLA
jgi:hypothetical protein